MADFLADSSSTQTTQSVISLFFNLRLFLFLNEIQCSSQTSYTSTLYAGTPCSADWTVKHRFTRRVSRSAVECVKRCLDNQECGQVMYCPGSSACFSGDDTGSDSCGQNCSTCRCYIDTQSSIKRGEWELLLSAKSGSGQDVLEAWTGNDPINPDNRNADIFKSPLVTDPAYKLEMVKISVLEKGEEKAFFSFDGRGANMENWMTKERLLDTSSGTLAGKTFHHFSQKGDEDQDRHFFISSKHGGCEGDFGWLVVVDAGNGAACSWMSRASKPYFLYCPSADPCRLDRASIGDTFTISAKFKN